LYNWAAVRVSGRRRRDIITRRMKGI